MTKCQHCGGPLYPDEKFCPRCGTPATPESHAPAEESAPGPVKAASAHPEDVWGPDYRFISYGPYSTDSYIRYDTRESADGVRFEPQTQEPKTAGPSGNPPYTAPAGNMPFAPAPLAVPYAAPFVPSFGTPYPPYPSYGMPYAAYPPYGYPAMGGYPMYGYGAYMPPYMNMNMNAAPVNAAPVNAAPYMSPYLNAGLSMNAGMPLFVPKQEGSAVPAEGEGDAETAEDPAAAEDAEKLSALQTKLRPVNLVVMLLCLVAMLSLIFAPFAQVDIGKLAASTMGVTAETATTEKDEVTAEFFDALKGRDLSFSTVSMFRFATAKNPLSEVVKSMAGLAKGANNKLAAQVLLPMAVKKEGGALAEKLAGMNFSPMTGKLKELETATAATKDKIIGEFADAVASALSGEKALTESDKTALCNIVGKIYDGTLEKNEGKFTLEAAVCAAVSESVNGAEGIELTYSGLMASFFPADGKTDGPLSGMENLMKKISNAALPLALAFLIFPGVYLVLFLFALAHYFAADKRFMMWYVKLFGGIPCVLFGILPLTAVSLVKAMKFSGASLIAALLGSITTWAWIGGACYVALWLISIFWAFPIKRKIRELKED